MTTTKGHLTATEKRHIKELLRLELMEGKINRKTYRLAKTAIGYDVSITEMETRWCEIAPKMTTHNHSFTV